MNDKLSLNYEHPANPEEAERQLSTPTGRHRVSFWRLMVAVATVSFLMMLFYIVWHATISSQ